jgi:hypothetical protein
LQGPLRTPPGAFLLRPGPDNWSPAQDQAEAGAAKSTTEAELGHLYDLSIAKQERAEARQMPAQHIGWWRPVRRAAVENQHLARPAPRAVREQPVENQPGRKNRRREIASSGDVRRSRGRRSVNVCKLAVAPWSSASSGDRGMALARPSRATGARIGALGRL